MKKSSVIKVMQAVPLFSSLDIKVLQRLINEGKICTYASGHEVFASDAITVILKGSVTVTKQSGEKRLLMRILGAGNVSGVASLFCENSDTLSILSAVKTTDALIIPKESIEKLIAENSEFALKYISFLTSRIRFLNGRIKAYTVGDTETKLALHLLISDEAESGEINLPISLTALADMLDMGRASLYRALDSLTEKGIIERQGKKIIILQKEALRRASSNP